MVPQDAYAYVRLLDQLIGELAAENFEQKLQNQGLSKKGLYLFTQK